MGAIKAYAILGVVLLAAGTALWIYVSGLRDANHDLTVKNVELTIDKANLTRSIEKLVADHNSEISRIEELDKARRDATAAGDMFIIQLDQIDLTKEPTDENAEDPVAGLNRLNAGANRMLEQSSR